MNLGDEYSENYPQIQVVLSKFHGLAKEISTSALAVIHRKLLADPDVKTYCHEWAYNYGDVYQFIELLYGIGFWGVRSKGMLSFRGVGTAGSSLPSIDLANSSVVIHPTYADALDLRDEVINNLPETINLQAGGGLLELPDGATLEEHHKRLYALLDEIKNLPTGQAHDDKYEDFVYNVINLCLRPYLGNLQKRSRTVDGRRSGTSSQRTWHPSVSGRWLVSSTTPPKSSVSARTTRTCKPPTFTRPPAT